MEHAQEVSDTMSDKASENAQEIRDELLSRHRKEISKLQDKETEMKKAAAKGSKAEQKAKKKQAEEEITRLSANLKEKHAAELTAVGYRASNENEKSKLDTLVKAIAGVSVTSQPEQAKPSKSSKRREKRAQQDAAREQRSQEEQSNLRIDMDAHTMKTEPTNTDIEEDDKKPYILQLPDHIAVQIFCKVPIKTLIQCQCVCKSWRHSLSDPQFTKHLLSQTPPSFLFHGLRGGPINPKSEGYLLFDLDKVSNPNDFVLKLARDPNVHALRVGILGSLNGLLCIYELNQRHFYISNPITSESLALPVISLSPHTIAYCLRRRIDNPYYCGFGFSPISNVYKVVVFMSPSDKSSEDEVLVLTVGSRIWRSIGDVSVYPSSRFQPYGVYLNGFLHWVGQYGGSSTFIWAFDVEREHFQQLPLPPCYLDLDQLPSCLDLQETQFTLGVLNGYLSVTVRSCSTRNINVWMMKDYGIGESWTKELEISNEALDSPTFARVLKFTEEGKVLLLNGSHLQAYTPGTRGVVMVEVDGIPSLIDECVHIPSFVQLRDIIAG